MCLACSVSHATVIFHNYGTTSGWSSFNLDSPDSITQSTSQVYKGTTSIKSQVVYQGTGYTGRYHAMVSLDNVYHPGDTGFYGFAFYLRSSWEFDNQQYQLFQFKGDFTDTGCDTWMPSTMVWIQGNQLTTRRKYRNCLRPANSDLWQSRHCLCRNMASHRGSGIVGIRQHRLSQALV